MPSLKKQLIERILLRSDVQFGAIGRFWGFAVVSAQRKSIVRELRDIGVTIHTLEDHVVILKSRYGQSIRTVGHPVFINLPFYGSWFQFDPEKRVWAHLYTYKREGGIGANTKNRSVLKCSNKRGDSYFVVFTSRDNKPSVMRVRKVAAYDIIGRMFESSQAYWIPFKDKGVAIIQRTYLKNIPDLIFNTLVRFKPDEGHIKDTLAFEIDDFELVKEVLSWIRTELVESSEVVKLPGDKDKLHGTPVVTIGELKKDDVFNSRLHSLLLMLKEMGGHTNEQQDHVVISGSKGSAKLYFVERKRSHTEGGTIYVALDVLSDPSKLSELLQMLQHKTGLNSSDMEKVVIQYWPLITPSDLEFLMDCVIKYYNSERAFVPSIINTTERTESLRRWLNEVKTGIAKADPQRVFIVEKALKQSGTPK